VSVEDQDDDTRRAMNSLRRLVRHMRTAAAATNTTLGVSAAQLYVLNALEADGVLSVGELAARTFTDQSSVSVVAQRLVDRGLLARRRSERDARRVELSLTEEAHRLLARRVRAPSEELVDAIHHMRPERRLVLAGALEELLHEMGIEHEPASMLFDEDDAKTSQRRSGRSVRATPDPSGDGDQPR
jgi:DNA-binding MarR family transcriptional regulator